jgi:ADP-ribosylglycohydrolase
MPSQLLSRADVVRRWGAVLAGFEAPDADHPVAAGLPAGSVTDDTEQALLIGRLLVAGRLEPAEVAAALLAWEESMVARGSADLLGPSTKRACEAIRAGVPVELAGRTGDTNGAAMRIAPVGVATPADDLPALVDAVRTASRATHDTGIGLAGAAAVAAAVSTGVGGGTPGQARTAAVTAARLAAGRGHWVAGADVAARIAWAAGLVEGMPPLRAADVVVELVGTSVATQESVPAAFAVAAVHPLDPWAATRLAASLGGDADTVAAIAGAVVGACSGARALPDGVIGAVRGVDPAEVDDLAARLLALRLAAPRGRS